MECSEIVIHSIEKPFRNHPPTLPLVASQPFPFLHIQPGNSRKHSVTDVQELCSIMLKLSQAPHFLVLDKNQRRSFHGALVAIGSGMRMEQKSVRVPE